LGRSLSLLDPSDERWLTFHAHKAGQSIGGAPEPCADIFHHPAWMNLLAECYGYRPFVAAACDASDRVCAALPMMEVNSAVTGRRWVSLPFTDHCRPLCRDKATLAKLVDALADSYRDRQTPRIEVRWELPPHPAIQSACDWIVHTIPLDGDVECVAQRMHDKKRRLVHGPEQKGVRIVQGTSEGDLYTFYHLHLLLVAGMASQCNLASSSNCWGNASWSKA
jgi:hypothetical protein